MSGSLVSRSAGIDLLRMLSVAIVIGSYYAIYPPLNVGGTRGVVIFFMVSGFCMAYSMQGRSGAQFLAKRFLRLAPTLVVCATITTIVEHTWPELRPDRLHTWYDYVKTVACLPFGHLFCDVYAQLRWGNLMGYLWVDGAYWSLLVELRFYILLWFLAYVLRVKQIALAVSGLSLLATVDLPIPVLSIGDDFVPYLCFFAFGLGVRATYDGDKWGPVAAVIAVASFALSSLVGLPAPSLPLNTGNFLGYGACFLVFISILHFARGWHNQWIGYIGVLTYPIYLLHQDVGFVIIAGLSPLAGALGAKCIAFASVIVLAIAVEETLKRMPWNKKHHRPSPHDPVAA